MHETDEDLRELQELIDRSVERMTDHMRHIFKPPERSLSARQIARYFQGVRHVAVATVTDRGEPRVAPLDGLLIRGRFHVSTNGDTPRVRHMRARPSVSLTHFDGDEMAVIVHGRATVIGRDDPEAESLEPLYVEVYESSPFDWGESVVLIRVDANVIYTYARDRSRYPE